MLVLHLHCEFRDGVSACLVLLDDSRQADRVVGLYDLVEASLIERLALRASHTVRSLLGADQKRDVATGGSPDELAEQAGLVEGGFVTFHQAPVLCEKP